MRLLFEQQNRLGEIVPFCLGYAVDKSGKHRDQLGKLLSFLIAESDALATGIMTQYEDYT